MSLTFKGDTYSSYSNEYTGNLVIPDQVSYDNRTYTVTEIAENAFRNCSDLASVSIPGSVITIGNYAFQLFCRQASSLTIAPTVSSIGDYAFSGCTSIASVKMTLANSDDAILTLGSNGSNPLFPDCPMETLYIGRRLHYPIADSEGYSPFYRNTSLQRVEIADEETLIYANEFYGCTNLREVTIGDGVTAFGPYAFSGCSKLEAFEFGSSVQSIGEEAFSDCTAMTSLTSHNPIPPTCGSQALDDINKWNCSLHVPIGALAAYQTADQWKNFFYINDDYDAIEAVQSDAATEVERYDLWGHRVHKDYQGVVIIRYNDGSVKKQITNMTTK